MPLVIDQAVAVKLRQLAHEAVQDALKTGTVGMSLSGGIDSSSVYKLAGHTIPCFTGYYEGEPYDERRYARLVAGPEHHEIKITPQDFLDHFDEMVVAAQPPFQGPGTFGQYMVARYARDYVNVMLSGEGGDELFGGYARLMIVAGEPAPDGYENYQLPDGYPDNLEDALQWDYERLDDLLAVDNQMLGAFDIQARAPFTDNRVVEFVLSLPAEQRVGKRLLKRAMSELVPTEILNRTDKRGFPTPFVEWAQGPIHDFVRDRIGYLPHPKKPWARGWWLDLCQTTRRNLLAT
jgi:asparagine synthetase B (glutamine-hydrolysing)